MVKMGERLEREEVEYIPARCICHAYYVTAYKCLNCSGTDKPMIQRAKAPQPLFQKSLASASVVAKVIYDKVAMAIPYHRQEKEWLRCGFKVPRRTLANWVILASERYLNQVCQRLKDYLLQAESIHADETPFQVLNRSDGKSGQSTSYIWVYCTGANEAIPIAYYQATLTREQIHPQTLLAQYGGSLTSDGYTAYAQLPDDITCQGCWSHVRRKYIDINPKNHVRNKALKYINQLFQFERDIADKKLADKAIGNEFSIKAIEKERRLKVRPIVEEYFEWLASLPEQPEKLQKAIQYSLNQQEKLMEFLTNGRLEATNNRAERHIRPITIVRKNANFATSEAGAAGLAECLTIIETAKANQLDPLDYLNFLLKQLSQYDYLTNDIIDQYLPWLPSVKAAVNPTL